MRFFTWGHRQESAPELPLYQETPADRYGRMKGALAKRAAHELAEDSPEMDLYRQFRLASFLTAGGGIHFSNMEMSADDWQGFVKERPNGFTGDDKNALSDLIANKLAPQNKHKPYQEAIRTLEAYLKQNKPRP